MPAAQTDPRRAESRQDHLQAVPVDREHGRRLHHGEGHGHAPGAPPDDLERLARGAGDRQVAALDDGGLLPGDRRDRRPEAVHVVEVDVRHDGHAAVPGVRRVEPATQPDLHEGDIELGLGEMPEDDRGQELELGRVAVASRDLVRDRHDRLDVAGEVIRGDGPAVDGDPLAIGHEVGLGGLAHAQPGGAQRAAREREHAPLAVGAGDERPAHGELRVAQLAEQGSRAPEAQPDPEPPAGGERGDRLVIVPHSRVSSSS